MVLRSGVFINLSMLIDHSHLQLVARSEPRMCKSVWMLGEKSLSGSCKGFWEYLAQRLPVSDFPSFVHANHLLLVLMR